MELARILSVHSYLDEDHIYDAVNSLHEAADEGDYRILSEVFYDIVNHTQIRAIYLIPVNRVAPELWRR